MNRRDTIKTLMGASGGLMALPAWAEGWRRVEVLRHQSTFSVQAQQTLAAVADTFIPAGDAIGALSIGVDKFLEKLIADCYEPDVQEKS